ncbi:MAG TPA: CHAT domain-containing protein [Chloroflexi bacterium]|nr:CHAT domain-containing protein [Chloroflexota bacterium]
MASCRFIDFDITIHGQHAPYLVHAAYAQHTAVGHFSADAAQPEWEAQLTTLARGRGAIGQEILEAIGAQLFTTLFHGAVRDLWGRACADLDRNQTGLCIRLLTQPPAVTALPWEIMFDPERKIVFAGSLQTPLVRVENQLQYVGSVRPLTTQLPLRMLVVTPEDPTQQIDGAAEVERLTSALGAWIGRYVQVVVLNGRFDVVALRQRIAQVQPDIVHLVTHGHFDGVLLWQHDTPVMTPAAALRVAFEGAHSVKLVVLNACATGQGAMHRQASSVGAQLLQTGAPAVIAMQYDIEEEIASTFAGYFYQELFGGECPGVVPRAVSFARSNLYALNPAHVGYATPILWLNAANGAIFEMERLPMPPFSIHHPTTPAHERDLKPLKRQRQEFEAWCADVAPLGNASLPVALRVTIQRPLQDALREINDLLVQLHGLESEPATDHIFKQYEEKLARILSNKNTVDRLAAVIRQQQEQSH